MPAGGWGGAGGTALQPPLSGPTCRYSLEGNAVVHRCRCCRELRASPRNVTLRCADGSQRAFSYTQVQECGCAAQQCGAQGERGPLQVPVRGAD